ncbi:MAG: tetratricopeptide repeat protein [Pseudanabaenaceae cyanobacterium bins.39]|nr:tetratricopeptide repeat protein [Pseudanabaenaceae cyanobacterium bins.39]
MLKQQNANLNERRRKNLNRLLQEELSLLKIVTLAYLKNFVFSFVFRFSSKKYFLDSTTLSSLLVKYFDLDIISFFPQNSSWKSSHYKAAKYHLGHHSLEEQEISLTDNIKRIEGYLQAFEDLCEAQDWERANKIINLFLDTKTNLSLKSLYNILINWGYEQRASNLYAKLWQYSDINGKDDYFITLGNLFISLLKYEEGIDCYEKALTILQSKKNTTKSKRECRCLNVLGQTYTILGDYQSAVSHYSKVLEIIIENERKSGCWNKLKSRYWNKFWEKYSLFRSVFLLLNVAAMCIVFSLGNPALAQILVPIFILLNLSIPESIGVSENILSDTLNQLGYVYLKMEDYQTAIEYYQKALDEGSSNKKNTSELIDSLCNVGDLYLRIGDSQNSIVYYQKALNAVQNRILINKPIQEGTILQKLGSAHVIMKDYQKAEENYIEALVCFQKIENRSGEALVLNCLGNLYFDLGEYEKAKEYYQQALSIYKQTENDSNKSIVMKNLSTASQCLELAEAETIGSGFERFTEKAIKVIILAQEESWRLSYASVDSGLILLGLIGEGTGIAAVILRSNQISLEGARIEVKKIRGHGSENVEKDVKKEVPFTSNAKRLLELSTIEADRLGHKYVGTEHLLLGLIRGGDGAGVQVLKNLSVNLQRLRELILQAIAS